MDRQGLPVRVVVYDQVIEGDLRGMNQRVAACYAWADQRGVQVVDEHLEWHCEALGAVRPALTDAIRACRQHQAHILIHCTTVVETTPAPTTGQRRRLAELLVSLEEHGLTAAESQCAPSGGMRPRCLRLVRREQDEEAAKITVLSEAVEQGWSDLAAGRFDDVDDESLDDFVGQLGVRAGKTQPAG